jgi:GT2 family glycosyltransferase
MRIAVVVATLGRPQEVGQLLERLARQTLPPCVIVLSVESDADLPPRLSDHVQVVTGPRGASAQRNRGIDLVHGECDIIAFFDDDFLPCIHSLSGMAALFRDNPGVVGATGRVLADGVSHGGIAYDDACAIVAPFDRAGPAQGRIERDLHAAYGCNMAFRAAAVGEIRFDENLPLYSWQEDVDFAARTLSRGRVVKTDAFVGVHRGVTRGRTSGLRFGFSQIVNPVYLVRKGTMRRRHAIQLILRNFVANHFRALWPEPWIDRRGRVQGNWIGLVQVLSGDVRPQRVTELR